ncbi:MAG: acyltransferase [Prevotellaceae bacterium]|nr:acyltransferase [Prevotellaceae bacterium]
MIDTLTSLRFIFALMVFGAHCYVIDDSFSSFFFKEGFVGVSFFFVLSGFIISYNYQKRLETQRVTRRNFWVARFARVYPLHWLTLFISILCGAYLLTPDWGRHFFASFTLTQAYIPQDDYFFSFNSPSWSLCCEQLFYILFPFLALWLKEDKKLWICFLLMAIAVPIGMYLTPEESIKGYWYVNPVTRFPDFVLGMILYRIYIKVAKRQISHHAGTLLEILAVIVFILFYFGAENIDKVYRYSCYYWLPVAFLLLAFSLQRGTLSRLLSCRILKTGGEISYGFYLIHLMVITAFVDWEKSSGSAIDSIVSVPLLFATIIGLSLASYYFFEKPLNKLIKKYLNN